MPGTDDVEIVLQALLAGFDPTRAAGRSAVVRIDVATPEGTGRYLVGLHGSPPTPGEAASSPPVVLPFDPFHPDEAVRADVSLALDAADLRLLAAGQLDLLDAFRAGRVRLSGDMTLARDLPGWLGLEPAR